MLTAVLVGIWGLRLAIPGLDPRRANIEQIRATYDLLVVAVIALAGIMGTNRWFLVAISGAEGPDHLTAGVLVLSRAW